MFSVMYRTKYFTTTIYLQQLYISLVKSQKPLQEPMATIYFFKKRFCFPPESVYTSAIKII